MATQTIDVLIEGGKATAAPPLGPALGPMGVNIGKVVGDINSKTASFKGMQVPVKVKVDSDTKGYEISIGTPPASALIKQEADVKKGSGAVGSEHVGEIKIEQVIKIAKMKEDDLSGVGLKKKVKEIIGTAHSMGIKVEDVGAVDAGKKVDNGEFDQEIKEEKTEISAEEKKELEAQRKKMQQEIEAKRTQFETQAKKIQEELKEKPIQDIRSAMDEAGIPMLIINKISPLPTDKKKK